MLRYLVVQSYELENDDGDLDSAEEAVIDFETYKEAEDWINEQTTPSLFSIKDQFDDSNESFEGFEESDYHDYDFYDMIDDGRYADDEE